MGKLVRIVKSGEQISEKGQAICPLSQADEDIQAVWDQEEEDEDLGEEEELQHDPAVRDGQGGDADVQEVQRHLPGSLSPLPPPTPDQLHPEEQDNIMTPEEGETYLPALQGEQENEAAHDLGGREERDVNANRDFTEEKAHLPFLYNIGRSAYQPLNI